jgi:Lipase (class 3)
MRTVPYDPSRVALFHPEQQASILALHGKASEDLLCAESSRLAYKRFESDPQQKGEISTALRSVGFEEVAYFDREGSQAFATWSSGSKTALVAFRGTQPDDPTDLADDLKAILVAWEKGGQVHKGFKDALGRLSGEIESWISLHPGRLLLTGHSLGAALSTLMASLIKPARLVTFGSPRVGDQGFVNTLTGIAVSRYVDCCDVVTRLPPDIGSFFEHVGTLIYLDSLGQVTASAIATDQFIQADRDTAREEYLLHEAWRIGSVAFRDLADHAPINYVYALE